MSLVGKRERKEGEIGATPAATDSIASIFNIRFFRPF